MRIAIPWQDFYSKCMNKPLLELAECHLMGLLIENFRALQGDWGKILVTSFQEHATCWKTTIYLHNYIHLSQPNFHFLRQNFAMSIKECRHPSLSLAQHRKKIILRCTIVNST